MASGGLVGLDGHPLANGKPSIILATLAKISRCHPKKLEQRMDGK
jgi:hypothetical protein